MIVWERGVSGTLSLDFPVLAEEECLGAQGLGGGGFRCPPGSAPTSALAAAAGCCALAGLTPEGREVLLAWLRGLTTDSEGGPDTWVC